MGCLEYYTVVRFLSRICMDSNSLRFTPRPPTAYESTTHHHLHAGPGTALSGHRPVSHPSAMSVVSLDTTEAFDAFRRAHPHVVVDFYATWCGPCKAMAPVFAGHARDHSPRLAFAKLDVDAVPEVAARYSISTIPTFLCLRDGEVAEEVRSAAPPQLKKAVESLAAQAAAAAA